MEKSGDYDGHTRMRERATNSVTYWHTARVPRVELADEFFDEERDRKIKELLIS